MVKRQILCGFDRNSHLCYLFKLTFCISCLSVFVFFISTFVLLLMRSWLICSWSQSWSSCWWVLIVLSLFELSWHLFDFHLHISSVFRFSCDFLFSFFSFFFFYGLVNLILISLIWSVWGDNFFGSSVNLVCWLLSMLLISLPWISKVEFMILCFRLKVPVIWIDDICSNWCNLEDFLMNSHQYLTISNYHLHFFPTYQLF